MKFNKKIKNKKYYNLDFNKLKDSIDFEQYQEVENEKATNRIYLFKTVKIALASLMVCLIALFTIMFSTGRLALKTSTNTTKNPGSTNPITENEEIKPLKNVLYPSFSYKSNLVTTDYKDLFLSFTTKTTKALFTDLNENQVYSPLSLYMAMAMLAEGASNNTLTELLTFLGVDSKEELSTMMQKIYEKNYFEEISYKGQNNDKVIDKLYLKNSLWMNKTSNVKDLYVTRLQTKYYSEVFKEDFSDAKTADAICNWLNKNTEGFLNVKPEDFILNPTMFLSLFNTIYFKGSWNVSYSSYGKETFFGSDGNVETDFIAASKYGKLVEKLQYTMFTDYLSDSKISYTMIMPTAKYSIEYIFNNYLNDVIKLINNENILTTKVNVILPKFDIKSSYKNIKEQLTPLGLSETFGPYPDLSYMTDTSVFVSAVIQNARIALDEKGIEAAAFTQIALDESASDKAVKFNLPFIYVLSNSDGIPLFIGLVNNF